MKAKHYGCPYLYISVIMVMHTNLIQPYKIGPNTSSGYLYKCVLCYSFTVINCGIPPMITNAHRSGNNHTYGNTVHYTCKFGFRKVSRRLFSGNTEKIILCSADGRWSGTNIYCQSKYYGQNLIYLRIQ